ncbi:MAG: ABC transporter permease [Bacteroidetes bacterium]|nr:ABC transporter permease [Bacteroidota bacterium]MBU2505591.1 ABC transporter permease [Bacteroidota bacterium]
MRTIIHIIKKEFLQFKRDPKMFGMILVAPVIQLIFLGYAVNMDVENVETIVFDQSKTETSRNFIQGLESSGYFNVKYFAKNYSDVQTIIENGDAKLGLVIPIDFEEKIERNETAPLQAIFDGSDGNTASISAGYVQGVVNRFTKDIMLNYLDSHGQKISLVPTIESEIRVWYNPELKTRNFMVPGIVGLLLSIITLILTSLAIVKEKEIGTLEQIIVSPIKPYQIIMGKLIPFAILGFIAVLVVITAMQLIFGIAVRGSITFLLFSSFVFILSTLGFGLFVSTISKTQQQAMMLAIFVVLLPMVFLSGFAFPIENMPEAIQYITHIIPLKYFMKIIRGVILKGTGFVELWFDLLILFILGLTVLILSAIRFSKRLE